MQVNEKFPWALEEGAFCDYTQGVLYLVIKDEDWNSDQIESMEANPVSVMFGTPMHLGLFLVEGGALDTCDFYFSIQDCDEKEALLHDRELSVCLVLLDGNDVIRFIRTFALDEKRGDEIRTLLARLNEEPLMPGEFDVNAAGLMSACEPPELARYARVQFEMKPQKKKKANQ